MRHSSGFYLVNVKVKVHDMYKLKVHHFSNVGLPPLLTISVKNPVGKGVTS